MRNIPFLLWVLLLVDGESNNVKEVKEGESVTLKPDEIKEDDTIEWQFRGKKIAYMIKGQTIHNTFPGPGDIFKDRLKLDAQTGSLTITNILAKHAGLYQLKISGHGETSTNFSVTVHVYKGVESMSKMEGASFSLVIDIKEQKVDEMLWMFGDQVIPTDHLNPGEWENTEQIKKTGELFFRNIRRDQSGVYKVKINTGSSVVHGEFHVTVENISIQTMSVMEGKSVTLPTDGEIQRDDLIMWMFDEKSTCLAEINREAKKTLYEDVLNGRFRGRLELSDQTGSLTITNTKITDEGFYTVRISSSNNNRDIKYKRFVVIVKEYSPWKIAGPILVVVSLVLTVSLVLVIIVVQKKWDWDKLFCKRDADAVGSGQTVLNENKETDKLAGEGKGPNDP